MTHRVGGIVVLGKEPDRTPWPVGAKVRLNTHHRAVATDMWPNVPWVVCEIRGHLGALLVKTVPGGAEVSTLAGWFQVLPWEEESEVCDCGLVGHKMGEVTVEFSSYPREW